MKILLNAIPLRGLMTGIGRYLRNLYTAIEAEPGVFVDYFDGRTVEGKMPAQALPETWTKATEAAWRLPDIAVMGLRSFFWLSYERRARKAIKAGDYNVFHETSFTPSAVRIPGTPQIFTLHDLSLDHCRDLHPKERVMFWDFFAKRRLGYADHFITPSQFVRDEVCEKLNLSEEVVTAVPEAADPIFFPRSESEVSDTLVRLGLPSEYLLFVGTLEPRKNLDLLIKALSIAKNPQQLVLAGWKGWGEKPWMDDLDRYGLTDQVHITGYVSNEDLARLYCGATAMVFPSRYEGFGLPLLEAMSCGCPVLSSSAASLPEVGGDAAVYFDPQNPEELASALDFIAEFPDHRRKLADAGLARSAEFTWQKAGRETLDVFRRATNT
jgi:alpha-1,3-rhamnosyl/mannosyltransferase